MYAWRWLLIVITGCVVASVWSKELGNEHGSLTRCCPSGHGILANHSCVPHDTVSLTPFVYNDTEKITKEVIGDESLVSACASDEALQQVRLDGEAELHLFGDEIFLYWYSSETDSWILVSSFCVAVSAEEDKVPDEKPQYLVKFCHQDPLIQLKMDEIACQNATCVRKCCPEGDILNGTCVPPNDDTAWTPVFHSTDDLSILVEKPSDMLIVYGIPHCSISFIYEEHVLLESGELALPDFAEKIPSNQYCLDMLIQEDGEATERSVVCHNEEYKDCWWRHFIVDKLFMSISCVFLAITWLIYVCMTELRTNTHGRCMISFITALFIAFVTILVNGNHRESFSAFQCSLTAVLSHMSILATFFWLSVLCYHIWNCLRSGRKRNENMVFLAYSLYGWGCPFVIALVGVILDATEADVLRPDFQPPHCWFKDRKTKWVYQYGFMLALLLVNLYFFLSSAVMVTKRLRQTQDMRQHSDGLWLYLKLFVIMGITWLMEMITWLLQEDSCTMWVAILDGITALHGVYIFLIAVCLRKDLRIFRKCCGKEKYDIDGNTVSCTRDNYNFVELDNQTK